MAFSSIQDIQAVLVDAPNADKAVLDAARARNGSLTKPPGALGRLEEIAIWYASWRQDPSPMIKNPQVVVFAGNHGIAAQGVSAFPAEVTAQMVMNFEAGGAAINQFCQVAGATMSVVALNDLEPTNDFSDKPAMDEAGFVNAFQTGWDAVNREADLFVAGEMGIANTTSAAAIAHAIIGKSGADWAGRGTGLDDAGVIHKARVISDAVSKHALDAKDGLAILACFGGYELAAIAGSIASARAHRIPVILDGFIASAAALGLFAQAPSALDHVVAGHVSAEQAHRDLLAYLGKTPLLDLGLRLGEGSGAALAINIVTAALACHSGMASFAEAGVSEAD